MSRFEKICWESTSIQMKVKGCTNIPELAGPLMPYPIPPSHNEADLSPPQTEEDCIGPFSPTPSIDSGRSTSSVHGPSPKYLLHGGPGFSLGLLDSTSGTFKQLPVPIPSLSNIDMAACDNFSLSEVESAVFAGDSQLWVGTETGSLHVFDFTEELRLRSHAYTKSPDPILCIATRQASVMEESLPVINGSLLRTPRNKTDVLIGSSHGNLTVIVGEANERGGLKNPLKCPKKVIQLGDFEEGESMHINSIALVRRTSGDTYWCGCGSSIVVLQRSDWREVQRLNGCVGLPGMSKELSGQVHVSQLLATEVGVWSSISHSSTVVLWDRESFEAKLKITCHNHCSTQGLVDKFAQISALHFSYPLLFVGTRGGHLLNFRIQEDLRTSPRKSSTPLLTHRITAATYCSAGRPVVSIHSMPVSNSLCPSPLSCTPVPTMHTLVVLGHSDSRDSGISADRCLAQLYELTSSPRTSPLTSPMQSIASVQSLPSSPLSFPFTNRKNSLASLTEQSTSLPKLSLVGAAKNSRSFLPLPDSH